MKTQNIREIVEEVKLSLPVNIDDRVISEIAHAVQMLYASPPRKPLSEPDEADKILIEYMAQERSIDYKPFEENLHFTKYYEKGFIDGYAEAITVKPRYKPLSELHKDEEACAELYFEITSIFPEITVVQRDDCVILRANPGTIVLYFNGKIDLPIIYQNCNYFHVIDKLRSLGYDVINPTDNAETT